MSEARDYVDLFRIAELYTNILKNAFKGGHLQVSYTADSELYINDKPVKNTLSGIIEAIIDTAASCYPDFGAHINEFKKAHPDKAQHLDNKLYYLTAAYVEMPEGYFE